MPLVIAQQSSQQYFLPQEISFIGEKSIASILNQEVILQRTFNIGPTNNTEPLNATFISSRLYSTDSNDFIPAEDILVSKNNTAIDSPQEIIINVNVHNQKSGVYKGEIIALFSSDEAFQIPIELVIQDNALLGFLLEFFVIIMVTLIIAISFYILFNRQNSENKGVSRIPRTLRLKSLLKRAKASVTIMPLLLLLIGIFIVLILSSFDSTVKLALISILFTPLIGYIISLLNNERDFRKKMQDLSYDYRNTMVQEDSQILRSIIGELTVHYASFNADDWPKPLIIPDAAWKESKKTGIISDIHTSFLARYYRYAPMYNECVTKVLELNKSANQLNALKKDFELVRQSLKDVETYMYNTVLYDLGLLQQRYLAREPVKFPIHMSEVLIAQLIKFEIVKKDGKITSDAYTEENASKFTTKIGAEFNPKYAELEINLTTLLSKIEKVRKSLLDF